MLTGDDSSTAQKRKATEEDNAAKDATDGPENAQQNATIAMPTLMRVMEDVFLSSISWLKRSTAKVIRAGITHIVLPEHLVEPEIRNKFEVFAIPASIDELPNPDKLPVNPYSVMPAIMDFLR